MLTTNAERDIALVEKIREGNENDKTQSFKTLFEKYYHSIFNRISSTLSDKTLVEDITMEVFEKAYVNLSKFKQESGAFSTWLYALARNTFIDAMRKQRHNIVSIENFTIDEDDDNSQTIEFKADSRNPQEEMERNQRHNRIHYVIEESLKEKPEVKEIVILRYLNELSYAEIAEITEHPLGTVKAHLHRAKELIQNYCEEHSIVF